VTRRVRTKVRAFRLGAAAPVAALCFKFRISAREGFPMRLMALVVVAGLLWSVSAGVVATFGGKPCRR